jgi:hypothetical protein
MAAVPPAGPVPPAPVVRTLVAAVLHICGANAAEINALETMERLDMIEDYAQMSKIELSSLATKLERRTAAAGRTVIATKVIKNVQALCFWASERMKLMLPLDPTVFDAAAQQTAKQEMCQREETKADRPAIKPEKFKPEDWHDFGSAFLTYVSNHNGAQQYSPLDCVTRPTVVAGHVHTTERDRQLYRYSLTGALYREDNKAVFRMLADLLMGTEGYTWIAAFERMDYAEMSKDEVSSLATKLEQRTAAAGRTVIATKVIKNVQALCLWAAERTKLMLPLDPTVFDAAALQTAKQEMRQRDEAKADKPTIKPDKFKPENWHDFGSAFLTYLSNHKGAQYSLLDYVTR